MKHLESLQRVRLYVLVQRLLQGAWNATYRHPWILLLAPLAVFFPLLDSRGLYEYGDANFPLNPFWLDYMLPWSGAASAGADNTFIGVPRLVYLAGINVLIGTFHNLQVAQWLWYSSMTALGLGGAYLLARRLGGGIYSVPLAILYAFNVWSYDRIAQGPIYLSYQALPLVVYLFLRYLARPGVPRAIYFACSLLLVIPALQVSYLAAVICLGISVRELFLRGWRVVWQLAALGVAVIAANAFYIFSMIADMLLNSGGNIALVNSRFNIGVFEHYAARVSVWNTLRLASFYFSTMDRQFQIVQIAAIFIPVLMVALLLLARRPTLRSRFYAGAALVLAGLWLVDGIALAPGIYAWFRSAVPGLRSFVEPDYFSPLYIFGAFVMLAAAARLGARAYSKWWKPVFWCVALAGILPFLPINGGWSGMPQTGQPRQYTEFSRAHVPGSTLWLPPDRGVTYKWSAYNINGFTSLNSPSDALGPTMAEWVASGTERVQARLADGFEAGQIRTVEALSPLLGVGTVAIAADSESPLGQWPNPEVVGALETFGALQRDGFLTMRNNYHDVGVHLVTATTKPPLEQAGIYPEPVTVGSFENFMWWTFLSQGANAPYVPIAADSADGTTVGSATLRAAPPPPLKVTDIPIGAFESYGYCTEHAKNFGLRRNRTLVVATDYIPRCISLQLRDVHRIAALRVTVDASPADTIQPELAFNRKHHDGVWVDPTLGAQEVPPWAQTAALIVKVPPDTRVEIHGVRLEWLPRNATAAIPVVPSCNASSLSWSEQNPLMYTVQGTVRGRCSVILRQSYAPIWALFASGDSAKVLGHLQLDGFANGWVVEANGPATFRIVNLALFAYVPGMALTITCLLLAIGFAVRSRLRRRAARAARRVPSPA